jgi:hypothetical protein
LIIGECLGRPRDGRPFADDHGSRQPWAERVITLWTSDRALAAAVPTLGECPDALRPDQTAESAGFNLLLVHVSEVVGRRDTSAPLRITAAGLQWPDRLPSDQI